MSTDDAWTPKFVLSGEFKKESSEKIRTQILSLEKSWDEMCRRALEEKDKKKKKMAGKALKKSQIPSAIIFLIRELKRRGEDIDELRF